MLVCQALWQAGYCYAWACMYDHLEERHDAHAICSDPCALIEGQELVFSCLLSVNTIWRDKTLCVVLA